MPQLYMKKGRPLQRNGNQLFAGSGAYLGTIQGSYVFDADGQYAGTIDDNRMIYRTIDSARVSTQTIAGPEHH